MDYVRLAQLPVFSTDRSASILSAHLTSTMTQIEFKQTIPILRIFDVEKAKEFYCGFLGFAVDWEHHFDTDSPAYLQLSRAGMTLHLSEHHGDCTPGATVFVWMQGIEAFYQEISSTGYTYNRPGMEETFYQAKCVEVTDPFNNRIRFNEDMSSGDKHA